MKIAMIGQKGIPSRAGGVEIHVEEIAKRLSGSNDVTVYCREGYCDVKYDTYNGVDIKYIKSINTKHLDAITYTFLATLDAVRRDYDIIQYHALGPSLLSFIPRLFNKKVVCTVHGLDWQRAKWGKVAKLALKMGEYASIKFPNQTISVSKGMIEYYKATYNKQAIYIPNGIDKKLIVPADLIKKDFNIEKDEYVLFLARLVPEKGVHYLIDAFKRIKTNKKLVIAGGSSHSDEYVKSIKAMASDDQRIIFTGFVTGTILDELFSNAYCYVLPSEIEGLPISLLEAMAYGQCCLVSDIKENTDVVESYAEIFENKNVDSLKSKLQYLIENKAIVDKYKNESRDFIIKKYNWDDIAKETEKVFSKVLKGY